MKQNDTSNSTSRQGKSNQHECQSYLVNKLKRVKTGYSVARKQRECVHVEKTLVDQKLFIDTGLVDDI